MICQECSGRKSLLFEEEFAKKSNLVVNIPYDEVFRTLLNDCSQLIIPVIILANKINCRGNEKIVFFQNEHFINQQDGKEQEGYTDTHFQIVEDALQHDVPTMKVKKEVRKVMGGQILDYEAKRILNRGRTEGLNLFSAVHSNKEDKRWLFIPFWWSFIPFCTFSLCFVVCFEL